MPEQFTYPSSDAALLLGGLEGGPVGFRLRRVELLELGQHGGLSRGGSHLCSFRRLGKELSRPGRGRPALQQPSGSGQLVAAKFMSCPSSAASSQVKEAKAGFRLGAVIGGLIAEVAPECWAHLGGDRSGSAAQARARSRAASRSEGTVVMVIPIATQAPSVGGGGGRP